MSAPGAVLKNSLDGHLTEDKEPGGTQLFSSECLWDVDTNSQKKISFGSIGLEGIKQVSLL